MDGSRLGSSTAISNYFEKLRSDNKRKLSPFILVPQISYDDYLSIGENDAYQKIPHLLMYPYSVNKFLGDYSNQFYPNAVYFDYMGSAGGNQNTKHFPFEDLNLYMDRLANPKKFDDPIKNEATINKAVIAMTFCLRTADIPLFTPDGYYQKPSRSEVTEKAISMQLNSIIESHGFKVTAKSSKSYQRNLINTTGDNNASSTKGSPMITFFMKITREHQPGKRNTDTYQNKKKSANFLIKSSNAEVDIDNKTISFRDWGFNKDDRKKNWDNITDLINDWESLSEFASNQEARNHFLDGRYFHQLKAVLNRMKSIVSINQESYPEDIGRDNSLEFSRINNLYLDHIISKKKFSLLDFDVLERIDYYFRIDRNRSVINSNIFNPESESRFLYQDHSKDQLVIDSDIYDRLELENLPLESLYITKRSRTVSPLSAHSSNDSREDYEKLEDYNKRLKRKKDLEEKIGNEIVTQCKSYSPKSNKRSREDMEVMSDKYNFHCPESQSPKKTMSLDQSKCSIYKDQINLGENIPAEISFESNDNVSRTLEQPEQNHIVEMISTVEELSSCKKDLIKLIEKMKEEQCKRLLEFLKTVENQG